MAAPLGNSNAKEGKLWKHAIKRALARKMNGTVEHGLDRAADQFVAAVFSGEQWAIKELGDRIDGRPAQTIIGDDDAPPVKVRGLIEFVSAQVDVPGETPVSD